MSRPAWWAEARRLAKGGMSARQIARIFGVSEAVVRSITAPAPKVPPAPTPAKASATDPNRAEIRRLAARGVSRSSIAALLRVTYRAIDAALS